MFASRMTYPVLDPNAAGPQCRHNGAHEGRHVSRRKCLKVQRYTFRTQFSFWTGCRNPRSCQAFHIQSCTVSCIDAAKSALICLQCRLPVLHGHPVRRMTAPSGKTLHMTWHMSLPEHSRQYAHMYDSPKRTPDEENSHCVHSKASLPSRQRQVP